MALGLLICVFTPLVALQVLASSKEPFLLWVYAVLDLFFVIVFVNFRRLDVSIYSTKIVVSFGWIRKTISLNDVLSCEPVKASLGVYTGNGIRFGGDGSLAFITSFGDAVKLRLRSGRPFVFTTNRTSEVIDLLRTKIDLNKQV
jgi:hypothetical protein